MYDDAGGPARTQAIVREILQRLYVGSGSARADLGDEDNGELSSWYILSSLGPYAAVGLVVHLGHRLAAVHQDDRRPAGRRPRRQRAEQRAPGRPRAERGGRPQVAERRVHRLVRPRPRGHDRLPDRPDLRRRRAPARTDRDAVTDQGQRQAQAAAGHHRSRSRHRDRDRRQDDGRAVPDDSSITQRPSPPGRGAEDVCTRGDKQAADVLTITSGASVGDPTDWAA